MQATKIKVTPEANSLRYAPYMSASRNIQYLDITGKRKGFRKLMNYCSVPTTAKLLVHFL